MSKKPEKKRIPTKPVSAKAPAPPSPPLAQAAMGAMTEAFKEAKTPEQMRELGKQFMQNVISNIGRLDQKVSFIDRHNQALVNDINDQFEYFNQCLGIIFTAIHQEMPKRMPRLLDAKVELTKTLNPDEVCEMQAAYFKKKHPTFGNVQVVIGVGEEAKTHGLNGVHPIVARRLTEAFDSLRASKKLVDGQFYFVRLFAFHSRPVIDDSVKVEETEVVASDVAQVPQ